MSSLMKSKRDSKDRANARSCPGLCQSWLLPDDQLKLINKVFSLSPPPLSCPPVTKLMSHLKEDLRACFPLLPSHSRLPGLQVVESGFLTQWEALPLILCLPA